MATDLSWVTDDNELEAIAKGDMSKVSDATLERLSAGDQPAPVAPMPIDDSAMREHFQNNITNHSENIAEQGKPKEAQGFFDALDAGWQMSVSGLALRQKAPDVVMNEHSSTFLNIASQAATLVGDLPAMVAGEVGGAFAGGAVGSAVPVAGTAVGAFAGGAAGAFALPSAMRKIMMDHYERGDIKTAAEFMERASATLLDTVKSAGLGIATMGAGKLIGTSVKMGAFAAGTEKVAGIAADSAANIAAKITEAATMTSVSAAYEGKLPEMKDFTEAAIFIGGMHAVGGLPKKLREVYAKTGMHPTEVAMRSIEDPTIKQDLLLSEDNVIPTSFEPAVQMELGLNPAQPPQEAFNFDLTKAKDEPRTLQTNRLELAKKQDPNAFRYLEKTNEALGKLAEERIAIEEKIAGVDLTTPEGPSVKAELEKEMSGINSKIDGALEKLDGFQRRVNKSYADATKQLGIDKAERYKKFPEEQINTLADEHANKEFLTPDTTTQIVDPAHIQTELELTSQGVMHEVMDVIAKDYPEVAKLSADKKANEVSPYTDAEQKMEKMIGRESKDVTPLPERIKNLFSADTKDKFRTDFIDGLHPFKIAEDVATEGKALDPVNSPTVLMGRANTYTGIVAHFLEVGVPKFHDSTKVTTRGLNEILGRDNNERTRLKYFMMADRGLEILRNKQEEKPNAKIDPTKILGKNFDLEAATEVVSKGEREFRKRAEEVVHFQNEMLQYLKDSGFLSGEQLANMQAKGKSYLPYYRFDPKIEQAGGKGFKSKTKPIKSLEGSEKDIIDPFESIFRNTDMYVRLAERQRATRAFVNMNEVANIENSFIRETTPKDAPEKFAKMSEEEQVLNNISESRVSKSGEAYSFTMVDNGKTRTFETTKEIYEAFEVLGGNKSSATVLGTFMRGVTKLKRAGIALAPEFALKNPIRDFVSGGAFVKGGFFTPKELFDAVKDIRGKTEAYKDYLKSGGAHSTVIEMNQDFIDRELQKANKEAGTWDLGWSTIRSGIDAMAGFSELTEEMTRVAAFKREAGVERTHASIIAGGKASKEVTVDFSKVGAKMAALRSITAFQGAQIQGADRYIRAIGADYERFNGLREKGLTSADLFDFAKTSAVGKSALAISLPTLILWAVNRDDERVQDLPDFQKNQSYVIGINHWKKAEGNELNVPEHSKRQLADGSWETNQGPILRVPMPQEGGLFFGAMFRKMLEKFDGENKVGGDALAAQILESFTPSLIPDVALPAVETYFNKSMFTGNKLVPHTLEGELPEHIYTPYTSELAKGIGKIIGTVPYIPFVGDAHLHNGANPIVVDNWIKSWTGTLGSYALNLMDGGVHGVEALYDSTLDISNGKPATVAAQELMQKASGNLWALSLSDLPVIKAFVFRHPSMGMQPIQDFYRLSEDAGKVFTSVQNMVKRGDEEGARREIRLNPALYAGAEALRNAREAIGQMSTMIKTIDASKTISPVDKRHNIDGLYYQINTTAKTMLNQMESIKNNVAK